MTQPADATQPAPHVTRLERRWLVRMVLIGLFVGGFSLAGLYDATVRYPARGRRVADAYLLDALRIKFDQPAFRAADVGTSDPRAELSRLTEKSESHSASDFDTARLRWLGALRLVGDLDPAHTVIADPLAKRQQLETEAAVRPPDQKAEPLSPWDLPVQWLMFVTCAAVALWMMALLFIVWRRRYTWEPSSMTLGLPGGQSLTPADIRDFDKRKWHKFIVFVNVKPEHPTLGGKSIKFDLYCHTDLESWILAMEKVVNPAAADAPPLPAPDAAA